MSEMSNPQQNSWPEGSQCAVAVRFDFAAASLWISGQAFDTRQASGRRLLVLREFLAFMPGHDDARVSDCTGIAAAWLAARDR